MRPDLAEDLPVPCDLGEAGLAEACRLLGLVCPVVTLHISRQDQSNAKELQQRLSPFLYLAIRVDCDQAYEWWVEYDAKRVYSAAP